MKIPIYSYYIYVYKCKQLKNLRDKLPIVGVISSFFPRSPPSFHFLSIAIDKDK